VIAHNSLKWILQNPQNPQKSQKHKTKQNKKFLIVLQFFHMNLQCKNTVVVEYFYVEKKAA
jgi:hypothetical protein